MRITPLIILATIMTSGCATEGQFSASREFDLSPVTLTALSGVCDASGGTSTKLYYGFTGRTNNAKKRIKIRGLVHVSPGEIFAIELVPRGNSKIRPGLNVEDLDVTISGKLCAGEMPPDSDCFLTAGPKSYNDTEPDKHKLIICVPTDQDVGEYFYDIEIEEIGTLDPRADVC